MSIDEILTRLEAVGPNLSLRVLDEQYQNPFWMDRFGARGRTHAEQDSGYHLSYLRQALAAGDPEIMRRYARWLRSVLVSRGMCSSHLAENFELLERAIAQEIPGSEAALAVLREARASLEYTEGPAYELVQHTQALIDGAQHALGAASGERSASDAAVERCRDDVACHLSYLADAIAAERPELFASYLQWLEAFLARRNVSAKPLHVILGWLRTEIREHPALSRPLRELASSVLVQPLPANVRP